MKKLYGVIPAMLTVWKNDQTYDKKGSERYVQWLLDNGAHGVSVAGSTGENITMLMNEQKEIIEHVINYINGGAQVIAGTGRYTTMATLELSKFAEKKEADGLLVILPYYLHPYKSAVMDHFRAISKEVNIPVIVYNNPWFAGYELTPTEVNELVNEDAVQGIKAAHGDANRVHELKFLCGDKLTIFYGHDYAAFEGLLAGADGWLSGLPAIFPKQCRQLYDAVIVDKDVEKAREIWYKLMPFINYFMYDKTDERPHWLEIFKTAMEMQGVPVGKPRGPLGILDEENKRKLEKVLEIAIS